MNYLFLNHLTKQLLDPLHLDIKNLGQLSTNLSKSSDLWVE